MEVDRARELLRGRRQDLEALLASSASSGREDRAAEDEQGADIADPAQPLAEEGVDDAVRESLREQLAAVDRAEARLAAGTYGRSIVSDEPIPDARLEAMPTAELTAQEQAITDRADQ